MTGVLESAVNKLSQCRVCGSTDLVQFLDLGVQPLCNNFLTREQLALGEPKYPLVLFFCRNCYLVQLTDSVPAQEMFAHHTYLTGSTNALVRHFEGLARELTEWFLGPGDLVVDIGSNDGTFLKGYEQPTYRVLGVEACDRIADIARQSGIPTLTDFFDVSTTESILKEYGPAKLVTAAGVWFHIEDLHGATEAVARLLTEDGVFVIQAMYLGDVFRNDAYDSFYHEHLCLYSFGPLRTLLGQHGLEVFGVSHSPIHGGSLTVYGTQLGTRSVQHSVWELIELEKQQGLHELSTYYAFAERVIHKSRKLRAMLENARDAGRRIWAYGAPAKSSTLLNFSKIGPDLIEQALEINPLKCGRLTPGTHIPVVDENSIRNDKVDDIVLLAWNFRESLESRARALLRPGGRILLPVPDPVWISGN